MKMIPPNPDDVNKVRRALGMFESAVKCGERWTEECEKTQLDALDALMRLAHPLYEIEEPVKRTKREVELYPDGSVKRAMIES